MKRYRFNCKAGMDDSWPSYTLPEINAMLADFNARRVPPVEERIRREVADEMILEQRVAERLPGERLAAIYRRMGGAS